MRDIFLEIVQIMNNDYSGWQDKLGRDEPDTFLREMDELEQKGVLSQEEFTRIVHNYLLDFNDGHIIFKNVNQNKVALLDYGFRVRPYENFLYITHVSSENRLTPGMRITTLGGKSIAEIRKTHSRYFKEGHPERENWMPIIARYEFGVLEDFEGNILHFKFSTYKKEPYKPIFSVGKIEGNTVLITITDFADSNAIIEMMNQNESLLNSSINWIIDVRTNYGGSDASFYPLLSYLMPKEGVELRIVMKKCCLIVLL